MRLLLRSVAVLVMVVAAWTVAPAQPTGTARKTEGTTMAKPCGPLMGGCGGVYFLVEPGEFWVEVFKRDRNVRDTRVVLRALLVSPDRQVVQEATIPDDGQPAGQGPGPLQSVRLSTKVERRGVYALNITVSNDRYGYEMAWAFGSNCPSYLIETARGHKDERHQEPIVLGSPEQATEICFLPRQGALNLEASGLRAQAGPLQMFDSQGKLLASLAVDATGKASHTFAAGLGREATPWRLHLPAASGVLNVDGLTRWETGDAYPNICAWTPDPASWFELLPNRWLLTPYRRTVYAAPGTTGEVTFQVRNEARQSREVQLRLEFAGKAFARLTPDRVTLQAGAVAPVTVRYTAGPQQTIQTCQVIATPQGDPAFSTYSSLTVKPGEAPALRALVMPIMLQPYAHENEQFGYAPGYPLDNQLYFDADNRPVAQVPGGIAAFRDGRWSTTELAGAVSSRSPGLEGNDFRPSTTKIAFDADGDMYLLGRYGSAAALLHSADGGRSFAAYALPERGGAYDLEQFSGHNIPTGPPALVRFIATAPQDTKLRWRRVHDLELYTPVKRDGQIQIGPPQLLSRQCIGFSGHSGMPSSVVSRGDKVHVTWGEATDPAVTVPGVPTYVATYDRRSGQCSPPALVGHGPPANDVHNTPSITMDKEGYLHVLVGTHGRPFQYARSLQPNDAGGGWTEAVAAADGSQTYVGFVCGADNTLHVVFRLWRSGPPHPDAAHATLAYQRKRPGQPWEAPKVLVVAPFSDYSVFYHRLTLDHAGRLFLSYDYWSTHWFYRNDHPGNRRAVLMSPDGGDTWQLAADSDLR